MYEKLIGVFDFFRKIYENYMEVIMMVYEFEFKFEDILEVY